MLVKPVLLQSFLSLSTILGVQVQQVRAQSPADEDRAYVVKSSVWASNRIAVCWEAEIDGQYAKEKGWVKSAVEGSWGAHGSVFFVGWGTCQADAKGIRIGVADGTTAPHTVDLGNRLDGVENGMMLNFHFTKWSETCKNTREECIKTIATHEFGHALGFSHEQNRLDTPKDVCKNEPQGSDGDFMIGAWDLESVMNYCNPKWNGGGKLSQLDIEALALLYKPDMALHDYHAKCDSVKKARAPECMAAMHRYCYYNQKSSAGYPQEIGSDGFGVACANATWYGDVSYSKIGGCKKDSQSTDCFAATHRYCGSMGYAEHVGIVQELGNGVAGVACIPTAKYEIVQLKELTKQHDGCKSTWRAQDTHCIAAVHRYCSANGYSTGGAVTEVGKNDVQVGCFAEASYTSVKV